jgi:hypothetical protein
MTLFDRILNESLSLNHEVLCKTGKSPQIACYLGMSQRRELMADFASQPFIVARKPTDIWPDDPQINGCKIFFVTKDDHYNIAVLNP